MIFEGHPMYVGTNGKAFVRVYVYEGRGGEE